MMGTQWPMVIVAATSLHSAPQKNNTFCDEELSFETSHVNDNIETPPSP